MNSLLRRLRGLPPIPRVLVFFGNNYNRATEIPVTSILRFLKPKHYPARYLEKDEDEPTGLMAGHYPEMTDYFVEVKYRWLFRAYREKLRIDEPDYFMAADYLNMPTPTS